MPSALSLYLSLQTRPQPIYLPLGSPSLALTYASCIKTIANTWFLSDQSTAGLQQKFHAVFDTGSLSNSRTRGGKREKLLGLAGIISEMMVTCSRQYWCERHLRFGLSRWHD